ncbi:TVP38/TMEM64 family protein [Thiovibrio frasassiensis]|uniref:TVP38/TMEM64 family membrane protein n=1 Tax=Thiovibrio frasassiensis TaxID=2984131 RepID=A0A9X4RLD5_9BACT|nr:TVP38/TMEM64 family protein [Thiovibrio frasassiensis]MDG4475569.1 TVP38/TMEM64 family protein [Thiovibrio frasassiensis]
MTPGRHDKKGVGKAVVFGLFITGMIGLFRFSPVREYIAPDYLQSLVHSYGPWGPVVFVLLYAGGICLFLPATMFTGIGALLFGTFYGFLYNELGAMLGASMAFFIGRYLGRDFAAGLIGDRLKKYDDRIAANGFSTVLYLRLVFFPFTPLNFGMGLTRVTFREYFFGTLFGIIAGGFVLTFFFATLAEVWRSGDWWQLLSWRTLFSLALFVGSFFIPRVIQKIKPEAAG